MLVKSPLSSLEIFVLTTYFYGMICTVVTESENDFCVFCFQETGKVNI